METGPIVALQRAIEIAGSQAELARRVAEIKKDPKIKSQYVWNWLNRDKQVPDWAVIAVEASTLDQKSGRPRVLRHDLRPDLYPEEAAA